MGTGKKTQEMKKTKDKQEEILELLRSAAQTGNLGVIPKELLSPKNLSTQDAMGMNILHIAASYGQLDNVPKDLLKPELLLAEDNSLMTVIHYAACTNQIKYIPKNLITQENLSLREEEGNTSYHYLANHGGLTDIPKSLLNEAAILIKNDFDKDVLDMAINAEFKEEIADPLDPSNIQDQSQLVAQTLSNNTLKKIIKEQEDLKKKTTHGMIKRWDDQKLTLCKTELKKRILLKEILQPKGYEEKSLEI